MAFFWGLRCFHVGFFLINNHLFFTVLHSACSQSFHTWTDASQPNWSLKSASSSCNNQVAQLKKSMPINVFICVKLTQFPLSTQSELVQRSFTPINGSLKIIFTCTLNVYFNVGFVYPPLMLIKLPVWNFCDLLWEHSVFCSRSVAAVWRIPSPL